MCYQIHLPDFVLTYGTDGTEIPIKKHKRQLKIPGWINYAKASHIGGQSIQAVIFLEHRWPQRRMGFKDTYICKIATKVIPSHFNNLSQGINHFYSTDTWTVKSSNVTFFQNSNTFNYKLNTAFPFIQTQKYSVRFSWRILHSDSTSRFFDKDII
jgi:hypothetical protein